MADYLVNQLFCSDDFIRSSDVRKAGNRSKFQHTLQTNNQSSLEGLWWIASGGEINIHMTFIMTCAKTIPEQIINCDFGDIKVGFCAECFDALKMR